MFVAIFVTGCQTQSVSSSHTNQTNTIVAADYWLNYFPTQCNITPWGDTLEERTIIAYYEALGVNVESVEVTPQSVTFVSCAACGCPSGETISIQTDTAGKAILLENGFVEEDAVNTVMNTNTNVTSTTESSGNTDAADTTTNEAISESETVEEITLSEADASLLARAEQLQKELKIYYGSHGSYPDDLTGLNTTVDTAGLTYTPIGVTPADYYDLSVDYSTGRVVLNP